MTLVEHQFLKHAFQAVHDAPLEPGDPRYVDLYGETGRDDDPIELMARSIYFSPEQSVHLLSGARGSGKTTELKRLQSKLLGNGYKAIFLDMDAYLNMSMPVDVSDFLVALAGAFGEAMEAPENLARSVAQESYWTQLVSFLNRTNITLPDTSATGVKVSLKSDPTFRQRLQTYLAGHLGALVANVHTFFDDCVKKLKQRHGAETEVVLIVDSVEHLRGSFDNARDVQTSMEKLFVGYADKLEIPNVHMVYAVPLYLKARSISLGTLGTVHVLPAIKVRDIDGGMDRNGVNALKTLVANRVDCARLFGHDVRLEEVILSSGGNIRDLLRILSEIILRVKELPVSESVVNGAIASMRAEFLPISSNGMALLARVALTHELVVESLDQLHVLSRWLDTRSVLLYRNGREWYDVHPMLRSTVLQGARELAQLKEMISGHEAAATPPSPSPPRVVVANAAPVALTQEMRVTLVVENYRALRRVRWPLPRGVSALVGPNGSGKTTLLDLPEFLRHALEHDVRKAIDSRGGPGNLRNMQAEPNAPVVLGVELDHMGWRLDLSPRGAAFNPLYGERATAGDSVAFDRSRAASGLDVRPDDTRPLLKRFSELPEGAAFLPLVTLLEGYRLYHAYDLSSVRVNGSQISSDERLHPDGRNIFSVLRNWRDRKETRPRWEFVLESLKHAFPDTFDDLDFDMAGQTVSGRIVAPQPDVRTPTYFAANGWLIALLHLAAVASTEPAGVVAIDEVENGLHPYAIRQLVEAMRRWAERTGISIVLATHSPVVIDQFKEEPDHLFVMEPGRETEPARIDELHDPEWLAHFSLGDLYAHDEFGAQHKDSERVA